MAMTMSWSSCSVSMKGRYHALVFEASKYQIHRVESGTHGRPMREVSEETTIAKLRK